MENIVGGVGDIVLRIAVDPSAQIASTIERVVISAFDVAIYRIDGYQEFQTIQLDAITLTTSKHDYMLV